MQLLVFCVSSSRFHAVVCDCGVYWSLSIRNCMRLLIMFDLDFPPRSYWWYEILVDLYSPKTTTVLNTNTLYQNERWALVTPSWHILSGHQRPTSYTPFYIISLVAHCSVLAGHAIRTILSLFDLDHIGGDLILRYNLHTIDKVIAPNMHPLSNNKRGVCVTGRSTDFKYMT